MKNVAVAIAVFLSASATTATAQNICSVDGEQYESADPCPAPGTVGEELARRKLNKLARARDQAACAAKFKGHPDVRGSIWDGSFYEVEQYLKRQMRDPDSFEAIKWTSPIKGCGTYTVGVRYRAKNGFGGYVVEEAVATLAADGQVLSVLRTK